MTNLSKSELNDAANLCLDDMLGNHQTAGHTFPISSSFTISSYGFHKSLVPHIIKKPTLKPYEFVELNNKNFLGRKKIPFLPVEDVYACIINPYFQDIDSDNIFSSRVSQGGKWTYDVMFYSVKKNENSNLEIEFLQRRMKLSDSLFNKLDYK